VQLLTEASGSELAETASVMDWVLEVTKRPEVIIEATDTIQVAGEWAPMPWTVHRRGGGLGGLEGLVIAAGREACRRRRCWRVWVRMLDAHSGRRLIA
jgi:hypothetical protein